jgi:hypothetical protein
MATRARGLLWRDLIRGGKWPAVDDGHELVFCPCVFVVVEAFPEGCESSLNLVHV